MQYSITEIVKITKGELFTSEGSEVFINDILIDSRKLISSKNCVFFALVTKRNDGHKYIDDLYKRGTKNFIVSILPENYQQFKKTNFILLKDTLKALQLLGSAHRQKFNIPVIGITGSNGKTIVKEWLYQLMSPDKKIIRSPKSYNSQIGVPLSVWQMESNYELAVFEAGISEPEEMENLKKIINPTIGIFTNIGQAHNENFIYTSQKIGEKLKLFTKVETLIYCIDHHEIQEIIIRSEILKSIKSFTWSKKQDADLFIRKIEKNNKATSISGIFDNQEINIKIPFVDDASAENAIHCWATMLHLGYENELIAKRMLLLNPIAMRLELKEGINNCSIINDSYNSDINSLTIALDFLNQQKQHKEKTVILSDILQSGLNEIKLYSDIADLLENKGVKKIIGIGPSISNQSERFKIEKHFYPTTESFLRKFTFTSFNNESILLKGARIFEFEQISKVLQQKAHETVLEINLNALINNYNYYRSIINKKTKIMAMVKAFSYGSGSFEIANALQFHRVDYLAVAYADEGIELRKAGISVPIMVMNPDEQSFDSMIFHNLEPEIYNFRVLEMLEKAIKKNIIPKNKPVKIHIKLDTGMHRLGFEEDNIDELISRLKENNMIYVQSVFSHLAASENKKHDKFTLSQIEKFTKMSEIIKAEAGHTVLCHILNSAGITRFPDAHFDMVRLGISLYGISTNPKDTSSLQNVSTLKSSISQIKTIAANDTIGYDRSGIAKNDMTIAIVPIGYADGLKRSLSNGKGSLFVNGKNATIVGNVCMDMCMIDVSDIPCGEGDEVIIFGQENPITKVADELDTIPYEILTNVSRRVRRVYFQE
ncbi:MAG: bifunctional UDP-N-acetylmuramoyl-tripeptide:D-alanyl-D-alanine ligase/alanine racemase [Bacteroidales bacterium]|nr:bifunctional UDP-N-acetylmuramoyl-tripeptide:D-alanyl-D-alanine ligase/alanine racemase [Bacteroidales bacterium]